LIPDATKALNLIELVHELELNGCTVVPAENVGSAAFLRALCDGRRTGQRAHAP
jgi:hypothetical protein